MLMFSIIPQHFPPSSSLARCLLSWTSAVIDVYQARKSRACLGEQTIDGNNTGEKIESNHHAKLEASLISLTGTSRADTAAAAVAS